MTTTSQLRSLMAQQSIPVRPALQGRGILPRMLRPALALALVVAAAARRPAARARARAKADTSHQRDGEHQRRHGRLDPGRRAARRPGRGVRLVKVGDFQSPRLRHRAARRPAAALRRRAGGARSSSCAAASPWPSRSWTSGSKVTAGGEQGLLSMAFAPGLRAVGAVLRLLHREERHRGDLGVPPRRRRPRRPRQRAARAAHGRPRAQPQRRPDDLRPGQADVRRHGRRRRRQRPARPARQRAVARLAAGQDPAHRPASGRAARRTRSRPRIRSSGARAPAARSTPTGCATRGASPSTAPPAT